MRNLTMRYVKIFIFFILTIFVTTTATGQTLNVKSGSVTYVFPATQMGDVTFENGNHITIMGKTFAVDDIDEMTFDDTSVKDNAVNVNYNAGTASVTINQTNTAAISGDEKTYILSGSSDNGSLTLDGSYKCTLQQSHFLWRWYKDHKREDYQMDKCHRLLYTRTFRRYRTQANFTAK